MPSRRSARSDLFGAAFAGFIVTAFCLLLLWHDPLLFWNDDYELSILPVFADVARSWGEGHWPLLSPYSWVCGNLAGEFQYGTFSIFVNAAVVLIWKFPLTFPQQAAALSITHLFVLAAGSFLLARDRKLSVPLSIFVALIAALNGWLICWGATDWFGALAAFTWLPWAWWAMEKSLGAMTDELGERTRLACSASRPPEAAFVGPPTFSFRRGAEKHTRGAYAPQNYSRHLLAAFWPAPFVYLLVTGGFPYTVLMLAVLIVWLCVRSLGQTKSLISILPLLLGVALGFGLSAPAWLAVFDYVHGSARETQPAIAHWQWIVPWRALPGLVLPCWTVNWADFSTRYLPHAATELSCGLVAPTALLAGLIWRGRVVVRQLKWELILLLLVLLLSMLPMFGPFRWSFRWLPFVHLLLALCAAEVLQTEQRSRIAATTAVILVITIVFLMWTLHLTGAYAFPLSWIFLALAVVWLVADLFSPNELRVQWLLPGITFASLLATYLYIPTNCGVPKYNLSQQLTKPGPLDPSRLYLAVYSPAEYAYRRDYRNGPVGQVARPGSTSMWARLRFVNGYSPILAAGVARDFKFFIHGEIDGDMGRHLIENESLPGGVLERIGVDGLVIAREIEVQPPDSDWQLEFSNEEGRVFHRRGNPLTLVRSVGSIDSMAGREFATAKVSHVVDKRNQIEAEVEVPDGDRSALVTISRPYFRGYQAFLGNRKLPVLSYRGLFPIIEVPAGSHGRLAVTYRPGWLIFGVTCSIACTLIVFAGMLGRSVGALRSRNQGLTG